MPYVYYNTCKYNEFTYKYKAHLQSEQESNQKREFTTVIITLVVFTPV